jgi:hypothetical protein
MTMEPGGTGYEPPSSARSRPAVIVWFRVYAIAAMLLYAVFIAGWIYIAAAGQRAHAPEEALALLVIGAGALLFGGFYAIASLVPYKPWGWTMALIAICVGLPSCLALAAIPLLIFWFKPETKAAFGRL